MSEKSVFREAWSSEMTSQSLPVLCFWSRGFVPPPEVKLDAFGTSKYGEGKSLSKKLFAILIRILRRSNRANKKICHIHFKLPGLSRNGPQGIGRWKRPWKRSGCLPGHSIFILYFNVLILPHYGNIRWAECNKKILKFDYVLFFVMRNKGQQDLRLSLCQNVIM